VCSVPGNISSTTTYYYTITITITISKENFSFLTVQK
jgi:hypothetical protein